MQATDIDVSTQCAAGHGRVTCFSVYGGPDLDFAADDDLQPVPGRTPACVLYVDTFLDGNDGDADHLREVLRIWEAFRPFLEREEYPKARLPFFPARTGHFLAPSPAAPPSARSAHPCVWDARASGSSCGTCSHPSEPRHAGE